MKRNSKLIIVIIAIILIAFAWYAISDAFMCFGCGGPPNFSNEEAQSLCLNKCNSTCNDSNTLDSEWEYTKISVEGVRKTCYEITQITSCEQCIN
jgi:hypothetical protein